MDQTKRRNPIISFLLSIVLPGLGHVYNGHLREGILLYLGLWLVLLTLGLGGLVFSLKGLGLICIIAAAIVCQILIATHAAIEAANLNEVHLKWYNKWYVYCALILAPLGIEGVILFAQYHLVGVRTFKESSVSMAPTLGQGDHLVAKWEGYGDRLPGRGDIIIFPFPEDRSKTWVKRVVGLPGDRIQIKDKVVFINEQRLEDQWGIHESNVTFPNEVSPRDNFGPADVPEGAVFVLGDNRDYSHDSRFWGYVEAKDIQGKALFIYWSGDRSRIGRQLH